MSVEWIGAEHGAGVTIIVVDAAPGMTVSLHRHPYEEVFVVHEGEVTFTIGDDTVVARGGDIMCVPANTPHGFTNSGDVNLKQVDIHVSPEFSTEWL